jgi:hypothetical protein
VREQDRRDDIRLKVGFPAGHLGQPGIRHAARRHTSSVVYQDTDNAVHTCRDPLDIRRAGEVCRMPRHSARPRRAQLLSPASSARARRPMMIT